MLFIPIFIQHLGELHIEGSVSSLKFVCHVGRWENLKKLSIVHCEKLHLGFLGIGVTIQELEKLDMPQLAKFELYANSEAQRDYFSRAPWLKNLEELEYQGVSLSESQITTLAATPFSKLSLFLSLGYIIKQLVIEEAPRISALNVLDMRFQDDPFGSRQAPTSMSPTRQGAALRSLGKAPFTRLCDLHIRDKKLTDHDIEFLSMLNAPRLKVFFMGQSFLTSGHVRVSTLKKLAGMPWWRC